MKNSYPMLLILVIAMALPAFADDNRYRIAKVLEIIPVKKIPVIPP